MSKSISTGTRSWPRHFKHQRSHDGDELVNFGRDSHLPAGTHADSVVSIFGSASSEGDAGDMVAILGDTSSSGHVKDSAVAVLGNVHIDGPVDGDVVAVFGNVELGPHADVGGDVTAVGGAVTRDPAAVVRGDVQSIGGFTSGFEPLQALDRSLSVLWPAARAGAGHRLGMGARVRLPCPVCVPRARSSAMPSPVA